MGFFTKRKGINEYAEEAAAAEGSLLLDVREPDEYRQGHLPGSVLIPLGELPFSISRIGTDLDRPIYIYCLTGVRAGRAKAMLERTGYTNVKNIGGIRNWKGEIEK